MVNSKGQASKYGWILVLIAIGYVIGVSSLVMSEEPVPDETKLKTLNSSLGKDFGYDIGLKDIKINSKVFDKKTNQKEGKKSKYFSNDTEFQIENEFEEKTVQSFSFVKETINITTNSTELYNYTREVFLGTNQIRFGGKLITLTETPIKLNGSFVDNEWIIPNIFYNPENKRINLYDPNPECRFVAYAYNESLDVALENINGSIYCDPNYINQSDGFFPTNVSAIIDIGGLDYSNSTSLWIAQRGSAISGSVYEVNTNDASNGTNGFSTSVDAVNLEGVAINGSASDSWIWVIDDTNDKIIRYNQSREPTTVVSTFFSGTTSAGGICVQKNTDGSTLYALFTDGSDRIIARYSGGLNTLNLSIVEHGVNSGRDIDCDSDGSFWIPDTEDDFIYHIDSDGSNLTDGFSSTIAGGTNIFGVAKNGNDFWLGDATDPFIFHIQCTDCGNPSNPTNLLPANNTILTDTTPNLNWTNSTDSDADVLTYNLDIATDSAFSTVVYSATAIPSGASPTGHNVSVTLNRTTYHWRVRADDGTNNGTYAFGNFTRNSLPTAPNNFSILNNSFLNDATPSFNVTNSTDVDGQTLTYNLEVSNASDFSLIVYSATGISSGASNYVTHTVTASLNETTHWFRVNSSDGLEESDYGYFNATIDITIPSITIDFPANNTLYGFSEFILNKTITDANPLSSCIFRLDYNNGTQFTANTTISCTTNTTFSAPLSSDVNLTLYANDSANNRNQLMVNFSSGGTDDSQPTSTLRQPTGTITTTTITINISATDNNALDVCYYNITIGAVVDTVNTDIPCSGTSLEFEDTDLVSFGDGNYILNFYANDTTNNIHTNSTSFTISQPGNVVGGGGGGSSEPTLKAFGEVCSHSSQCSSSLCDLSEGSINFGTCQISLCGNGIKDEGENFQNCGKDVSVAAQFAALGVFGKTILIIGSLAVLLLIASLTNPSISKFFRRPIRRKSQLIK